MKKVGIIVNKTKPRAQEALKELYDAAKKNDICLIPEDAPNFCESEIIAVLGGDGTLLRAVRDTKSHGLQIPLMGLNIGTLGYLTGAEGKDLSQALKEIAQKEYKVSQRQMLEARTTNNQIIGTALNEVVLTRSSGRLVQINLNLDGEDVANYSCDGIIASTPTGTTAYTLSAGGPIVMPGTSATSITVICPHTLSSRPIVIADKTRITLTPTIAEIPLTIYIDGTHITTLPLGQKLTITKSPQPALIAFTHTTSIYRRLSQKLGWGTSPLQVATQEKE